MTRRLRVLIVHNRYQHAGGEDSVVREEAALLEANGIVVKSYERHNGEIDAISPVRLAFGTVWSRRTVKDFAGLIALAEPDVVHAHNTFPLISPSLYYAAARARVPMVQTLHNFRLFCAQAMFMRNGKVCEDCMGTLPWRGIVRRCYRNSMAQSAVTVGMLGVHRAFGTYRDRVTRYIALNEFCRDKFIEAGLPADRIAIKPNFVDVPAPEVGGVRSGALFVGRLSVEKGTAVLVDVAARRTHGVIEVIGTGPEQSYLEHAPGITLLGLQAQEAVYARMRQAAYLLMPSIWYENLPRTLIEAFACGLPVIASRLGAMEQLVRDGETGLLFEPGDPEALAKKMDWADGHPGEMVRMGIAARVEYEEKYTSGENFSQLMRIYDQAMESVKSEIHPS